MTSRPWIWLLSGGLGILIAPGLVQFVRRPILRTDAAVIASVQPVESVADFSPEVVKGRMLDEVVNYRLFIVAWYI